MEKRMNIESCKSDVSRHIEGIFIRIAADFSVEKSKSKAVWNA
jgi:hypothetical protein